MLVGSLYFVEVIFSLWGCPHFPKLLCSGASCSCLMFMFVCSSLVTHCSFVTYNIYYSGVSRMPHCSFQLYRWFVLLFPVWSSGGYLVPWLFSGRMAMVVFLFASIYRGRKTRSHFCDVVHSVVDLPVRKRHFHGSCILSHCLVVLFGGVGRYTWEL